MSEVVLFRAHGSPRLGPRHLKRCISRSYAYYLKITAREGCEAKLFYTATLRDRGAAEVYSHLFEISAEGCGSSLIPLCEGIRRMFVVKGPRSGSGGCIDRHWESRTVDRLDLIAYSIRVSLCFSMIPEEPPGPNCGY